MPAADRRNALHDLFAAVFLQPGADTYFAITCARSLIRLAN
jgi:hypothetical protein